MVIIEEVVEYSIEYSRGKCSIGQSQLQSHP